MIVNLLSLHCDFCTAQVTDEFRNEADARQLMAEHGWDRVRVENGSLWDRCPKCKDKQLAKRTQSSKANKFDQIAVRSVKHKVWMQCNHCFHTYICDPSQVVNITCPREERHDLIP